MGQRNKGDGADMRERAWVSFCLEWEPLKGSLSLVCFRISCFSGSCVGSLGGDRKKRYRENCHVLGQEGGDLAFK